MIISIIPSIPASPRGGKPRTLLRFAILARIRFHAKRGAGTGYRFLGLGPLHDTLTGLLQEAVPRKPRRNPIALALEWQHLLDSGAAVSRADLARQLGVSRSHVTQVLRLLELPPEVQEKLVYFGDPTEGLVIGAHTLRSLTRLPAVEQEARVSQLVGRRGRSGRFGEP
jgi:hypothetical protein